jgi:hypothetical protein
MRYEEDNALQRAGRSLELRTLTPGARPARNGGLSMETPFVPIDPERLREEAHNLDLGGSETPFEPFPDTSADDERAARLDETIAQPKPSAQ